MKRAFCLSLLMAVLMVAKTYGQGAKQLTAWGGYTLRDRVEFYDTYGYIEDGAQWGVGLEFFFQPTRAVELSYRRMDTKFPMYLYNVGGQLNKGKDGLSLNYILLGVNNYIPLQSEAIRPYAGFALGIGIADGKDVDVNYTKFAWDVKLGLQIKTQSAVSFKIQTQLQSIAQGVSGGFYIGTGGAGTGVSTYSSIYQFGFSGGICFGF